MEFNSYKVGKLIEVLEISGRLSGHGALELQEYLDKAFDEERHYFIMDMRQVISIDGLGMRAIEKLLCRGMKIRLLNVKHELRTMFVISNKHELLKLVMNEKDINRAVSLFENEIN